ncbi:MAG TPA: ROK family protein [Verrucomicrobiae bacterium]|nr:ROK family protein [Verrucomicrobiae bacterium]
MPTYENDDRIVMTLDAGGTSFRFSAMRGNQLITPTVTLPSNADNLEHSLNNIVEGFWATKRKCPASPVAISFAFPGPADYPNGIIGDLPNLPAFRGGVALGPMLREQFGIPVFINNDGDLFTYGEAIAGFLPHVNKLLEKAGSPKRYKNLFGVTIGTGFGGGIVRDGELFLGDNSIAGEVWLLRHKTAPATNAEEGASIRAVRRSYAIKAGIKMDEAPDPRLISEMGLGIVPGDQKAAREAFRDLGEIVGDAMGAALTLIDGLAVVGGGLSGAWPLFLPALVNELNSVYTSPSGHQFSRLASRAFNLQEQHQLEKFIQGDIREIRVPNNGHMLKYDAMPRVGVGISLLGTSKAVSLGAYAFALRTLDQK